LQVILFQEQIFQRLRIGAKERCFGADSCQKYKDSGQFYLARPCLAMAWPCVQDFKANKQPEDLARPVPPVGRPCHPLRQPFDAFASCTSYLFSLFLT